MRKLIVVLVVLLAASPALASQGPTGTSTWADWEAIAPAATHFTQISASWVQPTAHCLTARATEASFWVGLGGTGTAFFGPMQVGTDSDCRPGGIPQYYAWFENYPHGDVYIPMRIRPGDTISARVTSTPTTTTYSLTDHTSGVRGVRHTHLHLSPDATPTAEWVVEGPYYADIERLTSFRAVTFTDAQAILSNGQVGTITNPTWTYESDNLHTAAGSAHPGPINSSGTTFTVTR